MAGASWLRVALLLAAVCAAAVAVDRGKFKRCDQSGFCKRNREYAAAEGASPYVVVEGSETAGELRHTFTVRNELDESVHTLDISHVGDGVVRVQVYPKEGARPYSPEDALSTGAAPTPFRGQAAAGRVFGVVEVQHAPLKLSFYAGDELVMVANGRELLNMEGGKTVQADEGEADDAAEAEAEAEAAESPYRRMPAVELGEERFGSHVDTKPRGPTSVSLDFSFPHSSHLFGIPSHASDLRLKSTVGGEPFRLYNLDVFEYELDEPMALYGAIPFMLSHRKTAEGSITNGLFWLNAAETWVDVEYGEEAAHTHWFSESGMVDFFVTLGPRPRDVFAQYTDITGKAELPPQFSISYHQCRWNYKDEADVAEVDRQMDAHNIPYDVIWLDIEHTDGKRYFTWDKNKFGTPEEMQANIASKGRKMVTIVDPHIKNDKNYYVHSEASAKGLYVKNKDGTSDYEGWCWPGSSSYLDFTSPDVRRWWGDLFSYSQYKGSSEILFTWNDMNEPSVFNGPEVTMQKDLVHAGGIEHRDLHNMFGMYVHMATVDGLVRRNADHNTRPFVLSRAFFAGSQRYGAIWTGDNTASWQHMRASMPMLLSLGVSGLPFVGADVGGFFGNPDSELLARWYQLGAYQPFFRAHAHLDTKRREPYLFDERTTNVIREAVRSRYALLPLWYTLFYETHRTGTPMMRPLWVEYPEDSETFSIEDQYLLGSDLLVAPALNAGTTSLTVFFPGDERWFDVQTLEAVTQRGYTKVDAPFEKIPVYQRGGSIVPKKLRPRRSSSQMAHDPITLVVAAARDGSASGNLYVDDGASFNYRQGEYALINFEFANGELRSEPSHAQYETTSTVERVIIAGLAGEYSRAVVTENGVQRTVPVSRTDTGAFIVRKPDTSVVSSWSIKLE